MFRSTSWNCSMPCGAILAISVLGMPAAGQTVAAPRVPDNLRVPEGNTAFLKGSATGTQNYICLPSPSGPGWKLQGPQATLFITIRWFNGEVRQQITTHFLSPNPGEAGTPARATWQSSLDTSSVWAKKIEESSDPNFVAQGAIPWLLLQETGTQRGPAGGSVMAKTTFIQRVNTAGGIMPTTSCTDVETIQFVPYTADYVFYRADGAR